MVAGCLAAATLLYMAHQTSTVVVIAACIRLHTHAHDTYAYLTIKISINLEFIFIFIIVDTIERCEMKKHFSHFFTDFTNWNWTKQNWQLSYKANVYSKNDHKNMIKNVCMWNKNGRKLCELATAPPTDSRTQIYEVRACEENS